MSVIAIFTYNVKPGRMNDFMAKIRQGADLKFVGPVPIKSFRMFRSTVPGPDTGVVMLFIEYESIADYGRRTDFENGNAEWRDLWASQPDNPETSVSVQLLTEMKD